MTGRGIYRFSFYLLAALAAFCAQMGLPGFSVWFSLMSLVAFARGEMWA